MKTEIIFWLNPKTGIIYHKLYNSFTLWEVGDTNQFGHVVLSVSQIRNKRLYCCNSIHELYQSQEKETIKTKIINKIINKLEKIKR